MNRRAKTFIISACFTILYLSAWPHGLHALIKGDINSDGKIDISDVVLCARMVDGADSPVLYLADMDGDLAVTTADCNAILRIAIGLDPIPPDLPPDPNLVAPKLNLTVVTDTFSATEFLYTGGNPIQTGVMQGTIQFHRAALLRGKVLFRDGTPMPGVTISILDHPEFGQTLSREDGMFDLVVNGGGYLTVNYGKSGYLTAQRQVNVPWQDYVVLPDVILVPLDPNVTLVDLTIPGIKVARGSLVSDSDGNRQATLFFPEGVTAEMVMPDSSTLPITSLNVRATEFTVGPNGPKAMPAELPPNVAYTYAVEFTVDEGLAAGAKEVRFSQPVIQYLENFLNFPVGTTVPAGYYDRGRGTWVASDSGMVIKILGVTGGLADLDTDGNGVADNLLGISDAERAQLALLYSVGPTLWRVPIPHFSPWDHNWPFSPPADAQFPKQEIPKEKPLDDPCLASGSIVECQNQTLAERMAVTGTSYTFNYVSDRVLGRIPEMNIPLTGNTIPASLKNIELEITVAGCLFTSSFPAQTNQVYTFTWDAMDAYGRRVQGAQWVTVRIKYVYDGVYQPTDKFGSNGGGKIEGSRTRQEVSLWQEIRIPVASWDALGLGLGGWTLSVHHALDPFAGMLRRGDGSRQSGEALNDLNAINTVAGNGQRCLSTTPGYPTCGDGAPAIQAAIGQPAGITVGSDGSIYITNGDTCTIKQIDPNGIITNFAGTPGTCGFSGDGGPATGALLRGLLYDLAFGSDGSLYVSDRNNLRIRKIEPNGLITTVAGNGTLCTPAEYATCGDGGPATSAKIGGILGMDVGPDGSLYMADVNNNRIRRVGPDGIITTVAGTGVADFSGDGGSATQATFRQPIDVAVARDGGLYIADQGNYVIRKVGVDGIIRTVAGTPGQSGYEGDGGPATLAKLDAPRKIFVDTEGILYINVSGRPVMQNFPRIRRVWPSGIIDTIAGNGIQGFSGDLGPATQAQLYHTDGGMALSPDGSLYIADQYNRRIRKVSPIIPGVGLSDNVIIPSKDGPELYYFDKSGRHLRSRHSLTGMTTYEFAYDTNGFLIMVTDGDGNVTTVERSGDGKPTALVGPYGQRTTLQSDVNGYISSITNPASESVQFAYSDSGLMSQMTDARGSIYQFSYDVFGRLTRDENPAGGSIELTRTDDASGYTVVKKTTLNRQTAYRVERPLVGPKQEINTFPAGSSSTTETAADGVRKITLPDGTGITNTLGPDPRFGMLVPIEASQTVTTPGGLTFSKSETRSVVLSNPFDPLSITSQISTLGLNGKTHTFTIDVAARSVLHKTPETRLFTTTFDGQGWVLTHQPPGMDQFFTSYDASGRPFQFGQGPLLWSLNYDGLSRVSKVTDPAGKELNYAYDNADRVTGKTLPSNRSFGFGYDSNGNLTSLSMPSGAVHNLSYTPTNHLQSYTPPGGLPLSFVYDNDQNLQQETLPTGRAITYLYDGSGRFAGLNYPEASVAVSYFDGTERISSITRDPGTPVMSQTIAFTYDASLVASGSWSGASSGVYQYRYDNDFRLVGMRFASEPEIVFSYDGDSLLRGKGPFTITLNGPAGAPDRIADGILTIDYTYDSLRRLTGRSHQVNGNPVYSLGLTWDNSNRIVKRIETYLSSSQTYDYAYDTDGQLLEVKKGEVTVESYAYDLNGNRSSGGASAPRRCMEDEGRSLGAGLQEQASNHLKLHWSRAIVVSVKEKAGRDPVR